MRKMALILLSWFLLRCPLPLLASSQDFHKAELFGGYSYAPRPDLIGPSLYGWNISGASNLNRSLGLALDIGGLYSNRTVTDTYPLTVTTGQGRLYTIMFGPRLTGQGRLAPYAHFLIGAARCSSRSIVTGAPNSRISSFTAKWAAALSPGIGLNLRIKDPWTIRVIQIDGIFLRPRALIKGTVRLSLGVVLHLGR
jgi:hypothetical protein